MTIRTSGGGDEQGGGRKALLLVAALVAIIVLIVVAIVVHQKSRIRAWVDDLGAENEDVRIEARRQLTACRGKAVAALRAALSTKTGPGLAGVANLLGRLGDASDAPALMELLSGSDDVVRRNAAFALGSLRAKDAVEPLVSCLDDSSPELRRRAAWALGRIGEESKSAVPKLIEILSSKKEEKTVILAVADALGGIRDSRGVDPLVKLLGNPDYDIVGEAAEALGEIGDKRAVPGLRRLLFRSVADKSSAGRGVGASPENIPPEVRVKAIEALKKIGGPEARAAIQQCAKTALSAVVKRAAEKALKEMGE